VPYFTVGSGFAKVKMPRSVKKSRFDKAIVDKFRDSGDQKDVAVSMISSRSHELPVGTEAYACGQTSIPLMRGYA
jgi:hypothetical protein